MGNAVSDPQAIITHIGICMRLIDMPMHSDVDVKAWYLHSYENRPNAMVGFSKMVPKSLVVHLMNNTNRTLVTVKFVEGDAITEIEGAYHTLVVPIVYPTFLHGWTAFRNGRYVMDRFPPSPAGLERALMVVVSCLVQPDFETDRIMARVCRVNEAARLGKPLAADWELLNARQRRSKWRRLDYDLTLARHMIYHFAPNSTIPGLADVASVDTPTAVASLRQGRCPEYLTLANGQVIYLQMLASIVNEQIRVELATLRDHSSNKLVYTWEPDTIFSREIGEDILDELWLGAFITAHLDSQDQIVAVVFNDYRNKSMVAQLRAQLPASVDVDSFATYDFGKPADDVVIVIHTNSDAFKKRFANDQAENSLEAAIAARSSLAASLTPLTRDEELVADYFGT